MNKIIIEKSETKVKIKCLECYKCTKGAQKHKKTHNLILKTLLLMKMNKTNDSLLLNQIGEREKIRIKNYFKFIE